MDDLRFFDGNFELPKDFDNSKLNAEINKGNYKEIFNLPFVKILCDNLTVNSAEELKKNVCSSIQDYFDSCNSTNKELEILHAGIFLINLFIQKNWTGPDISNETIPFLNNFQNSGSILTNLALDGENVVSVVDSPEVFYLANTILEFAFLTFEALKLAKLWYLRSLFIHQQILEEFSPKLYEKINTVIDNLRESLDLVSKNTAVALHLEFGRIYLYYGNCQKAKIDIQRAIDLSGMDVSLSGALGKRTKFQTTDLAQLIVKIDFGVDNSIEYSNGVDICEQPLDLKLDDDVRLDKIKFADPLSNYCPNLTALHQATVLGHLMYTQKSQPKDNLASEELLPYINCILYKPKSWATKMSALLVRSNLQASHKRTVEHSMMQTQILVDALKDSPLLLEKRLLYFFTSYLPPKWQIKSTLANILVSIGSVKSALEIYLSLENWENIIYCYSALQLRHKAQEIIEQELKKNPTPKLWCHLGDATDDITCYEKAWKLSKERSARSQRHWALFYYYRRNYAASIEHFQKSLEINSLQNEIWYKLAYAALMEEKWQISAQAYRRYVVLDPECFEAWNNLGRCYCELKQKHRAYKALQEALKIDNFNWRVWDNYMIVASDLQEFNEVVKSYNEILNLKEKHIDIPILSNLVEHLKSNEKYIENQVSDQKELEKEIENRQKFRTKLLTLFGRLTSQVINNSELWFLYSEIVDTDSPENLEKKRQLLLKAHRSAVSKINWEKDVDNCNKIIYILSKLIQVGLLIQKPDVLMSCKMAANNSIAKIKKEQEGVDICDDFLKNLKELENALELK